MKVGPYYSQHSDLAAGGFVQCIDDLKDLYFSSYALGVSHNFYTLIPKK